MRFFFRSSPSEQKHSHDDAEDPEAFPEAGRFPEDQRETEKGHNQSRLSQSPRRSRFPACHGALKKKRSAHIEKAGSQDEKHIAESGKREASFEKRAGFCQEKRGQKKSAEICHDADVENAQAPFCNRVEKDACEDPDSSRKKRKKKSEEHGRMARRSRDGI